MCEICKIEKALYMVKINSKIKDYPYEVTYRCESCSNRASRSYEDVEISRI